MKFPMNILTIFGPFLFWVYLSPKASSLKKKKKSAHSTELMLQDSPLLLAYFYKWLLFLLVRILRYAKVTENNSAPPIP